MEFISGVALVLCLLPAARGEPDLLDPTGHQGVQSATLAMDRAFLPQIPSNPTAAYFAGQRAGMTVPNLPLYIKLHNAQSGGKQAAELQFGGGHHTASYGSQPQVQPAASHPNPIFTQEQPSAGLSASHPPLYSLPIKQEENEYTAAAAVVTPNISLNPPSVTIPETETAAAVPAGPPLPLASHAPATHAALAAVPTVSSVPQKQPAVNVVVEQAAASRVPVALHPTLQISKPATLGGSGEAGQAQTIGPATPDVSEALPNALPYSMSKDAPFMMYRLPLPASGAGKGHYVIMVPNRQAAPASAGASAGKQHGVTVYLATDVRVLKPHQHREVRIYR